MEALNTQSLDALERASSHSARDEQPEKEADAAAGPEEGRSAQDLLLPLQARGKSRVACAQQAHLEQVLADTTQLQSQADAALERMTRQCRALKRIPVTCPSCGTLNVPKSGSRWSAGDLVPCQECSQPFLPLSNSFQEADLLVLKAAVQRLRDQAEQIQYLESLKKAPAPKLSPAVPQEPWSPSKPYASPVDRQDARQFLSPCSPSGNDRRGDLTPSTPESGHLDSPSPVAKGARSAPGAKSAASRLPIAGDPLSPQRPQAAPRDDRMHQPLMSFLDTQDLLTNSSSSSAPMFHGKFGQLDTEQKTREVLQRLREDLPRPAGRGAGKREREEGEIVSASESEAGSRWPSQEMRLRPSPGTVPWKQGAESRLLEEASPVPAASFSLARRVPTGELKWQYLLKLFTCLALVCFLRCLLQRFLQSSSEVATSILAASVTGGGLTLWRSAEQTVERQNQLETSKSLSFKYGLVCLHWELGGLDLRLNTEEAFGLASLLGELAPVFVFENWGLHGSIQHRWIAVLAHVASSLGLAVLVRRKLAMQVSEAWLGLALGNWVASTWAVFTWWPGVGDQAWLPVLALATVQLINFWLAQSSGQPHLLASCVALGGLSMAGAVCGLTPTVGTQSVNHETSTFVAPGIYILFCAVSALLLFQEFFMSL